MNGDMKQGEWLCRNCNSLVNGELDRCPKCFAERPEVTNLETTPESIEEVKREDYTRVAPQPKDKYIFREAVLVNVADIILTLGIFAAVAILILPNVTELDISKYTAMMGAICIDIVIVGTSITSWALLRTIADISRRLRMDK